MLVTGTDPRQEWGDVFFSSSEISSSGTEKLSSVQEHKRQSCVHIDGEYPGKNQKWNAHSYYRKLFAQEEKHYHWTIHSHMQISYLV